MAQGPHVNASNNIRRNNLNPNAGVWQGGLTQGEPQPAPFRTPVKRITPTNWPGRALPTPEGQMLGAKTAAKAQRLGGEALRIEALQYGISGDVRPGVFAGDKASDQFVDVSGALRGEQGPQGMATGASGPDAKVSRGKSQFESIQESIRVGTPRPSNPKTGKPLTGGNLGGILDDVPKDV